MIKSRRFAAFDRGREGNIKLYGQVGLLQLYFEVLFQPNPPEYSLSNVTAPLYLYYSDYDWLANAADVETYLMRAIPKSTLRVAMRLKEFNHNDFLWGLRARKEIYERIVNIIKLDNRRLSIQREISQAKESAKESTKETTEISIKAV